MATMQAVDRPGILKRTRQVLKYEGFGSFLLRVIAAAGYRTGIWCVGWYVRPLDKPMAPVSVDLPLEFCRLGYDDVGEYVALRPRGTAEEFNHRLNTGNLCYGARLQGRLVSNAWLATRQLFPDYLGRELPLEPGQAYFFDSHTVPEYRGRRLLPWIRERVFTDLREQGCREAIAMVAIENRSSIAMMRPAGYRRTGTLIYVNVGPLRWNLLWGRRR